MNFYPFHIGDYRSATAHLSEYEDLAYRRMIDMYYDTESPLTTDTQKIARLTRSYESDVKTVLDDFFTEKDDGWHHERCDKELATYKKMAEGGKAGAAKRWSKGRDAQAIAPLPPPQTLPNANHEPITINQEPLTKEKKKETRKSDLVSCPSDVSEATWGEFVDHRKRKKASLSELVLKSIASEAEKAGWTLESALKETIVRNWQAFKAEWVAEKQPAGQQNETVYQRSMRLRMMEMCPEIAAKDPNLPSETKSYVDFFENEVLLLNEKKNDK